MFCPPLLKHTEHYIMNQRNRDAIKCLCFYLINSKLDHINKILPYLIDILEKSLFAKWSLKVPK